MAKHHEQSSGHVTEWSDILPSPEAVYNKEGHIKPSFLHRFAGVSLEAEADKIEGSASRRRLILSEKSEIANLRERAKVLKSKVTNPRIPTTQLGHIWVHIMRCPECKQEVAKIRGDLELPLDAPPLTE